MTQGTVTGALHKYVTNERIHTEPVTSPHVEVTLSCRLSEEWAIPIKKLEAEATNDTDNVMHAQLTTW